MAWPFTHEDLSKVDARQAVVVLLLFVLAVAVPLLASLLAKALRFEAALAKVALFLNYFGGTFVCNPLKPTLQIAVGSDYARAYRHFSSNHSVPLNLAIHLGGLFAILNGTFALMHEADRGLYQHFGDAYPMALAPICSGVVFLWGFLLMTTDSPLLVRALAVPLLVAGFLHRWQWRAHWPLLSWLEKLVLAINIKYGDGKAVPVAREPPFFIILAACAAVEAALQGDHLHIFEDCKLPVNLTFLLLLAYGSVDPFRKSGWHVNCYWSGYVCGALALLTKQPWLFFYGVGYNASLLQGVGHEFCSEAANLPELATRTGPEKAADEHAHTTFFPCLILHACYQCIFEGKRANTTVQHMHKDEVGRILITGCAGRIGRAVTEHLVARGFKVRGFDRQRRPASLLPRASQDQFEYMEGDLASSASLSKAVDGCQVVCHFAAVPDDADFEQALCPVNILGLHRVLEACRGKVRRLIVASSGKIFYHRNDGYPIRIEDAPKITCNYGATKLFLEGACEVFAQSPGGCETLVLRLAWCPFAAEDVAAMAKVQTPGQGRDEYMSPGDCSRCVQKAATAHLQGRRFLKLFCQSLPPVRRPTRFDLAPTKAALGWEPHDTYPTGIDWILGQTDYVKNPDLKKRVVAGLPAAAKRQRVATE